jgi:hypothetical protein
MTQDQLKALRPGDIVQGKASMEIFVVTANYGDRVTAVKTVDITNPAEWNLVWKSVKDGE